MSKLIFCVFFYFLFSASILSSDIVGDSREITIDISSIKSVTIAYKKFSENTSYLECFEVYIEESAGEVIVSFLLKNTFVLDGDKITKHKGNLRKCGVPKSYVFDRESGELLREIFQK